MKSNNLFHAFLLAALLAAGTSCSEFLDTSLDRNETGESIETTRGTLWKFGNAFYTPLASGFSALDSNLFAAATDEAQQTRVQSDASYFNKGVLNANLNPLAYQYTNCYEGIRAANFFLDYTADGKGERMVGMNRDTINDRPNYLKDLASLHWYQAEAHIARAWYYAELVKQYGGVPIVETPYAAGRFIARSSYEEVVEYIVREIDDWKDRLAVDWSAFSERNGRFTLGAALAIKARVLLYAASPLHNPQNDRRKWERAAAAAWEIIAHPELDYALDTDYGAYFRGNRSLSSPETIYVVRREQSNALERSNYPVATPGGGSGVTPTQNLVEAYERIGDPVPGDPYANRDPRLAATVVTNGSTWNGRVIDQAPGGSDDQSAPNASKTGYYLKKFLTDDLNLTQDAKAQHNWVAYRYAEVLLNYAEAMNEAYGPVAAPGDYTLTALDALQLVRDRASLSLEPVTTADRDELRKALKRERFVELAFEDHRYWDLLRWKDAMEVLNRPVRGVEVQRSGDGWSYTETMVAARTFLERNYYMPFTRSEVVNSNNTLRQNPGY